MKYRKYPNWVIITNKEIPFPYKARDTEKQKKVLRQQKPRSATPSSSTVPATPAKRSQKSVHISEIVTVNLVSPEGSSRENGCGTDSEEALENEKPEEEFIDINEILGPQIATSDKIKGKEVENKPRVVTRSGRVVKVVDKDNF
jgi:hypothetical protein